MTKFFSVSIALLILFVTCLLLPHLATAKKVKEELIVCKNSKSNYQIVLPDKKKEKDKNLNYFLDNCAGVLQYCIKEATGAKLPIVYESELIKDKPGIFLGSTRKALVLGINPEKMRDFQYEIRTAGKNIFLVGRDQTGKRNIRNYAFHRLGTVKAVTSFLKKYLNVEFVMPGINGIAVPKMKYFVVPADINTVKTPKIEFCMSRSKEMIYDIANNLYPSHIYACHGGHSYPEAIPVEKYGKSHPEYFYIRKGKRLAQKTRPQYCLSNPEVQELIYQELLTHIDQDPGYEVVQLAQSDGFLGCSCEKCISMYGVKPRAKPDTKAFFADPAWGIKVWKMHIEMAKRFLKDRPGKMITLSYYGPTRNIPKSLTELPANTIVDMSYYEKRDFARWSRIKVPGGFYVTIKNWGKYLTDGYTPKHDPDYIVDQLKRFHKNNVKAIYKMGFGELFGLEGPVYYLFGQLLEKPDLDKDQILRDYYQKTYGKAAGSMEKFFDILHDRLKKFRVMTVDWNDADLLAGKLPKKIKADHCKVIMERYPESVLTELEKYLTAAEKTEGLLEKEKIRLHVTRIEFDYLQDLAKVFNQYKVFEKNPSMENLEKLEQLVKKRTAFINGLFPADAKMNTRIKPYYGIPLFGKSTKKELLEGWGKNSRLKEPFNWDFNQRKKRIK